MKWFLFLFLILNGIADAYEVSTVELSQSATEYPQGKKVVLGKITDRFPSSVDTIHALFHFRGVGKEDTIQILWICKDALPESNIELDKTDITLEPYTDILHIYYKTGRSKLPPGHYSIAVFNKGKLLFTKNFTIYSLFNEKKERVNDNVKIYLARGMEKNANGTVTPIGVSEYFPNSQHKIFVLILFKNIQDHSPFSVEWYVVQSGKVQNYLLYKIDGKIRLGKAKKEGVITGNIQFPKEWPSGLYEVVFRVDGKIYARRKFAIGDVTSILKIMQMHKKKMDLKENKSRRMGAKESAPIQKRRKTNEIKRYAGFQYRSAGCYKDQGNPASYKDRDLHAFGFNSSKLTVENCVRECGRRNFKYAAVQYGQTCICDNEYGRYGKAGNCDMPCSGDAVEICGGSWANSVYEILNPQRSSEIFTENLQFDIDRPGRDYKSFDLPYPDYKLCQDACQKDEKCKAWAYVKPYTKQGPMPKCWLKNVIPPAVKDSAVISGYKREDITPRKKEEEYVGCYKDQWDRDLSGYFFSSDLMTPEACKLSCAKKGFSYAGVQYGGQCFCGNGYGKYGKAENCDMPCSGDASKVCGGTWANSVYRVSLKNRKTATKESGKKVLHRIGCYRDQWERDLNEYNFDSPKMTPGLCVQTCAQKGFSYAGVQYGSQCFCGNTYGKYGTAENCDMKCSGDSSKICGGTWANTVYKSDK